MELHMINITYAALHMRAQTKKTTFSCKDDSTLTEHTRRWTYSALRYFLTLLLSFMLNRFFHKKYNLFVKTICVFMMYFIYFKMSSFLLCVFLLNWNIYFVLSFLIDFLAKANNFHKPNLSKNFRSSKKFGYHYN